MQKPLGYVVAALIGAVVFVIAGYLVYTASGDAVGFAFWLERPLRYSVHLWALLGIAVGAGLRFVTAR